jgi:hypothetical protein
VGNKPGAAGSPKDNNGIKQKGRSGEEGATSLIHLFVERRKKKGS